MGIFDEREPSALHMLGMHGSAYANYAVQSADLILALGSRFGESFHMQTPASIIACELVQTAPATDDRTTGIVSTYAPEARAAEAEGRGGIVHFDIEKTQFGRVLDPTVCVEGVSQ